MKKFRYSIHAIVVALGLLLLFVLGFNVEAFCPFGAVESMYTYFHEGQLLCSLGVGNFYMLIAVLLVTFLFRRVFCGYICPIGIISSFLRKTAAYFKIKELEVPTKLDNVLKYVRFLVLIIVLFFTAQLATLVFRNVSPCIILASGEEEIEKSTYIAGAITVIASILIYMPFCRWFCPFSLVQNVFSKFGLAKIHRDKSTCVNCGKCATACPMNIQVDKVEYVKSAECISCFECIEACPVKINKEDKKSAKVLSWRIPAFGTISSPPKLIVSYFIISAVAVAFAVNKMPFSTFRYSRDVAAPATVKLVEFETKGVTCAGSAKLFIYFLNREDISEVEGYLKIATSPKNGWTNVSIWYDPELTDDQLIFEAITEPYYDENENRWRPSPFEIKGYDIL